MRRISQILVISLCLMTALPAGAEPQGRDSVGVVDQSGVWKLTDPVIGGSLTFAYGNPADVPFAGDWDCDGIATPGLYRRSTGQAFLRNSNSTGAADITFMFGNPATSLWPATSTVTGVTASLSTGQARPVYTSSIESAPTAGAWAGPTMLMSLATPATRPSSVTGMATGSTRWGCAGPSDGFVYLKNTHATGNADVSYFPSTRKTVGEG